MQCRFGCLVLVKVPEILLLLDRRSAGRPGIYLGDLLSGSVRQGAAKTASSSLDVLDCLLASGRAPRDLLLSDPMDAARNASSSWDVLECLCVCGRAPRDLLLSDPTRGQCPAGRCKKCFKQFGRV